MVITRNHILNLSYRSFIHGSLFSCWLYFIWLHLFMPVVLLKLVLVRYLIPTIFIDTSIWFDTRYSILDTFVVNVISSTYSGATWNDCAIKKNTIFQKKKIMRHCGKTKSRIFFSKMWLFEDPISLSKIRFFLSKIRIFLSKIRFFPPQKSDFFPKTYEIRGGGPLLYTTFRKHTKSGVWSLSKFPCFILYAARNIPSISDTMWCKAGFILRTP